jgi:manganese transport protein
MKNEKEFHPSLQEVNASVETSQSKSPFKKLLAFFGPAYLVSVGYMDPGNWATDIAGGSKFGYQLLWVLLMSNLIALLLQSLSARLGIVRNRDLAQASRETYPRYINISLYILAEIAIAACDLAEVLGMAIGLQLLFGISLTTGVLITVLDTFLLLFLINLGIRKMEAFIISLVALIGFSFLAEIFFAKPQLSEIASGLIPSALSNEALYIAIGIIGATVMPHNLYLHSSLVQTRKIDRNKKSIWRAIRFNIVDSTIALNMAFFVNAAILILAAAVFHKSGLYEVAEIQDAHQLLAPMLGNNLAPILFAVALIAAGQSSTITGTLAGQIVMEGYINLRIHPWVRRLLTRLIAIAPALITIHIYGERSTGELLVLSQVILSLQLGFAIIPLIHFVSDKHKMGDFAIGPLVKTLAWICALIIVGLNIKLVAEEVSVVFSSNTFWLWKVLLALLCVGVAWLLMATAIYPIMLKKPFATRIIHPEPIVFTSQGNKTFKKVAIALDFSSSDKNALENAISIGGSHAHYLIIHAVESAGAITFGKEIEDMETQYDKSQIDAYITKLTEMGYFAECQVVSGSPANVIPEIVNDFNADLLVMGQHGHSGIKDFLFGTTIDKVRHKVFCPLLVV